MTQPRMLAIVGLLFLCLGCEKTRETPLEAIDGEGSNSSQLHRPPVGPETVRYRENFSSSATGWSRIAGPGLLEVVDGSFTHTTTDWCEYAFTPQTFGEGRYQVDVFVDGVGVNVAFVWRSPDTSIVTPDGGAYQATFNAGGTGHFVLEKFDPIGRTTLLDVPELFPGLNRLVILDRGGTVSIKINGVDYGRIDVSGLTETLPGYIVLIAGDYGGGDYFDNVGYLR